MVQQETFGPVLCVLPYDSFDDALALTSDHQYCLASVLFSNDYQEVMLASNEIEAGELYIHRTPADPYLGYHAGWKRSGLGGDDGETWDAGIYADAVGGDAVLKDKSWRVSGHARRDGWLKNHQSAHLPA